MVATSRSGTSRSSHDAQVGPFGAAHVADEVRARFLAPPSGGRATDPDWTEQRLVKLTPRTLRKLEAIAGRVTLLGGQPVAPLQVAALLLESATEAVDERDVARLARKRRA